MILIIDNYDSFVFNLARYFEELGCETMVVRNDEWSIAQVIDAAPRAVVLSPGPCTPTESGICIELVRSLPSATPVLGVCLGHQSIVAALGGEVIQASAPMHGRTSVIEHQKSKLFDGIPTRFRVTRYHSLIAKPESLPPELRITASTDDGIVMAVEHDSRPIVGVQFHPESVLTEFGPRILSNFLTINSIPFDGMCAGDAIRVEACGPWLADELSAGEDSNWGRERDGLPLNW
jgi:anthranilate synthase/aminodeoxychorismate synthase-like glutamine amidotransferase